MMGITKEELLLNVSEALKQAEKLMAAESWKDAAELMNKAIEDIGYDFILPDVLDDTGYEAVDGQYAFQMGKYQEACKKLHFALPPRCDGIRIKVAIKNLSERTEEHLRQAASLIDENRFTEAQEALNQGIQTLETYYEFYNHSLSDDASNAQLAKAHQCEANGDTQASVALLQLVLQYRLDKLRTHHEEWLADF